jgi:hypothetical protein
MALLASLRTSSAQTIWLRCAATLDMTFCKLRSEGDWQGKGGKKEGQEEGEM